MDFIDLLENHLVINGSTDSGKSTFAEYLFVESPYKSLYYDQQDERNEGVLLETDTGQKIPFSPKYLKEYDKLLVYSEFSHDAKQAEIRHICKQLLKVGSKLPPRKIWFNLFVDEAHEVAPKHDKKNILNFIATKGKRYGISLITISQRPSMLSHTILTQSKNKVFFRLSNMEAPYFREYKIPLDQFKEWVNKDYHFVIMNHKDEIEYFQPISLDWKKERNVKK